MSEAYDGGRLADDLRALVSDAETLLRTTANAGSEELQERAQATLRDMRRRLAALEGLVREHARDVDTYVHDNPWQSLAVVGGVALLLGLILGRR
ncbi:MAG TPA: hypothetical protein VK695_07170 [Steroidobacteraceae bacterium]|jgi:ElaB/YqjD/DUF883 family membrane-anchored ribosome-binding protein|nr:hypothetical protein [Steroidobacteraceae bacterium]